MNSINTENNGPIETVIRFYRRIDWFAFWFSTLIVLAVYCFTLPPSVTLEDSGELATAAAHLGVPHPPGYPVWTIISWYFTKIFFFVKYMGQPNPAWSISLVSAVFGALAAGFSAALISRSGSDILRSIPGISTALGNRTENIFCWVAGVSSSMVFAFSPVEWSQAVIVEVYSLNAFFLTLILFLTYAWMKKPEGQMPGLFWPLIFMAALFLITICGLGISLILKMDAANFMHVGKYYFGYITIIGGGLAILSTILWKKHPENRILLALAFIFGLGLGNYQVLLLLAVTLMLAVMLKNIELFRDTITAALPYGLVYLLIKVVSERESGTFTEAYETYLGLAGIVFTLVLIALAYVAWAAKDEKLLRSSILTIGSFFIVLLLFVTKQIVPITHPTHDMFYLYLILNIVWMAVVYFFSPNGKIIAPVILFAQAGVLVYAFMPFSSETNPPMNWGYPRTWEGFKHAIFRGQYERIMPTPIFSLQFVEQIGDYLRDLRGTFTLPLVLPAFLPFAAWRIKIRGKTFKAIHWAMALIAMAFLAIFIEEMHGPVGAEIAALTKFYRALIVCATFLSLLGVMIILIDELKDFVARLTGKSSLTDKIYSALILLGFTAILLATIGMLAVKIGEIIQPLKDPSSTLSLAQQKSLLLQALSLAGLIIIPPAVAGMIMYLMDRKFEMSMDFDNSSRKWFIATLSGFLVMSVVLVALASPKGDIQDAFIQRVKFISSHAFFSLWIGYGMLFGLSYMAELFRGNTLIKTIGVLAIGILAPLIPIHTNYSNPELIRIYGGAEQNKHDFGWQFGNYQLRGADAIIEELSWDEEPLPNPSFPPEMGTNAVFFGGTDPGRFVPTYMIFGADVRPDVALITQNALADNTYMSVMRDLYGDLIWIPAVDDSAKSFQRYIQEVETGVRPRTADMKVDANGRVQISGAIGVMEVNGILAEMIFTHNNYKHDFYVEESYVIPWMYPHLTPHGLIMKINRNQLGTLTPKAVSNDQDFWDWYHRRLMSNPAFSRDVTARKSFSKLRSAIAGLYAHRRMFHDAETAYRQASLLYPLSPEANFRIVQEVMLQNRRFDEAIELMELFHSEDPGNKRIPDYVKLLRGMKSTDSKIVEMEQKYMQEGKMEMQAAIELAQLYLNINNIGKFSGLINSIIQQENLPPQVMLQLALFCRDARQIGIMNAVLDKFTERYPSNQPPELLIDVARLYAESRQPAKMLTVLNQYLKTRPEDWRAWLDAAVLNTQLGDKNAAREAVDRAIKTGGVDAIQSIRGNKMLAPMLPSASSGKTRSLIERSIGK